jgi:hypothetical protein
VIHPALLHVGEDLVAEIAQAHAGVALGRARDEARQLLRGRGALVGGQEGRAGEAREEYDRLGASADTPPGLRSAAQRRLAALKTKEGGT